MLTDELFKLCSELQNVIESAYNQGVTLPEAEKLAARFLSAQMTIAQALQDADLNARMKKTGVKAIKAAIYMEAATKDPKKPSDTLLEHLVNMNALVMNEQSGMDTAEVELDNLQNYFNIFREGHIFFRGIAKGRFE